MTLELQLNSDSMVTEVASNDGYLLQYFHKKGIPVCGIEPAKNIAKVANSNGIHTENQFLGKSTGQDISQRNGKADLVIANNVLAHVPDLHDFVAGLKQLIKPRGIATFEFPHVLNLLNLCQFDTIYHEHFSYLSLITVENIMSQHALK
ncbi:MAG: class I SAM-dependent methyltransferase, partial [Pseudomonadota bacterium]